MAFKFSNKVNSDLFTKNFTPESSYILGLLWADGYISKTTNSISLQCLQDDIDYFLPIFLKTGKFNTYTKKQSLNNKLSGTINFSSKPIADFLKENDYTNKSHYSPCKILSHIPNDLHKYFFLGWNDGDGCFYHNSNSNSIQCIITSSHEQDWKALENLCNTLDIQFTIRKTVRASSKYSQFQINQNESIIMFGEYLYSDHNIGLPRKKEKYLGIKSYVDSRSSRRIFCYSKDNTLVNTFPTLMEASNWIGKSRNVSSDINDVCVGRQATAFGYKWQKSTLI
jgi:hypothetical protein